jgi:hypothetical protein
VLGILVLVVASSACGGAVAPEQTTPAVTEPREVAAPSVATTAAPTRGRAMPPKKQTRTTQTRPGPKPVALPVSSEWSLPPMIVLQARSGAGGPARKLRRAVLRSDRFALSPAARKHLLAGQVAPAALALLLRVPRTGGPLLVFHASGRSLRVQETALWMTRRAVRGLVTLPAKARPARLLLEPMPDDTTALAGPPQPKPGDLPTLVTLYREAGYRYGVDWRILAAINRIETNYGQNQNVSSAGAVGWMQFMPSTWRAYGVDASGDGVADPYDPRDAVYSAARYLAAAGAATDIRRAVFAYNHADWYVNDVLRMAAELPASYGRSAASTPSG